MYCDNIYWSGWEESWECLKEKSLSGSEENDKWSNTDNIWNNYNDIAKENTGSAINKVALSNTGIIFIWKYLWNNTMLVWKTKVKIFTRGLENIKSWDILKITVNWDIYSFKVLWIKIKP